MRKVSPFLFINRTFFILASIYIPIFTLGINSESHSFASALGASLGIIISSLNPYGRDTAMMPIRRDLAYGAYLKAQKILTAIYVTEFVGVLLIKRIFNLIDINYWNIVFSAQAIFLFVMIFMYACHTFSKRISRINVINTIAWFLIILLWVAVGGGVAFLIILLYSGEIMVPDMLVIACIPISILLYWFVDKFRYRVTIKAVLDYDYAPGNNYKLLRFSQAEYEKLKWKRKELEHGCSNR